MSGVAKYVHGRNPEIVDDPRVSTHPDRPATAQKIHRAHERNDHHVYDTDTESFDATRTSFDDQDHAASDDFQDGAGYDQYGEQSSQDYDGHGFRALGMDLNVINGMMSTLYETQDSLRHPGHAEVGSYPPTTSGEPDPMEDSSEGAEFEHPPAQLRPEQLHDVYKTKDSQRHTASPALPVQTKPLRPQHHKEEFKIPTKSTISQKHVQHQKRFQAKAQPVSEPVVQNVPEQLQAPAQKAAIHKSAARVANEQPHQAHRQPSHAQNAKVNYHQQQVNEADHHHQQYMRRANHQEQHLNGFDHQQQHGIEESLEENYEQNTHIENLDHNLEELYAKEFDELQKEPFDGPPREDVHDAPSDPSRPLDERLASANDLDVPGQKRLFSSLSIEEWEEAGDWFQERFSEVFGKLKDARRKRRNLASEFEKRVAERQQALNKKRKITDDALSEMKKSGSQVLMGTPKKKQKSMD
ncbi:hypothetical protein E4T48_00226 [Aureobasidium sp. EXF-10727]|nr:hypothetical protein E4T48_00226 [Aureobasidium sp. EXF-10727]